MSNGPTVTAQEETGLTTRTEHGRELSMARQAAQAQHEVQSAITVAIKFPRNEDQAFGQLMQSCKRATFAEKTVYEFPRGGALVRGASSHLAREAARVWGNIQYGFEIVRDDDETIHLRGFAWDMQTNSKVTQDAHFRKLVQRKVGGKNGKTQWVKPDERDLRELINKHGAIAERNCVLKLLPPDLIEDAIDVATQTHLDGVNKDPSEARKKVVLAFGEMNISVTDLEQYLEGSLKHATPQQLTQLRTIYRSIRDGNSTWSEYVQRDSKDVPAGVKKEATMDDILSPQATSPMPKVDELNAIKEKIEIAKATGDIAELKRLDDLYVGPESVLDETQRSTVMAWLKSAREALDGQKTKLKSKDQLFDKAENAGQ